MLYNANKFLNVYKEISVSNVSKLKYFEIENFYQKLNCFQIMTSFRLYKNVDFINESLNKAYSWVCINHAK